MVKTEKIKRVSINWDSLLIRRNSFCKILRRKRRRQVGKPTGKLIRKSSKDKRSLSNLDSKLFRSLVKAKEGILNAKTWTLWISKNENNKY